MIPGKLVAAVKLIVILREPISRDLSHFNHVKQENTGTGGTSNFAGLCETSSYAANVNCEIMKWRECVAAVGLSDQNGAYEQYSSCPGWDRVMMTSPPVADEDKRLDHAGKKLIRTAGGRLERYPMSLSLLAQGGSFTPGKWAKGSSKNGHTLLLAKGMYSGQLRRWRQSFRRSQLLVLSFESLRNKVSYPDTMHRVLKFTGFSGLNDSKIVEYGLPLDELPKENLHNVPDKVTTIQCETKRQLEELFEPWNNALYQMLNQDVDQGEAPKEEQAFPEFAESVPCGDREVLACEEDEDNPCEEDEDNPEEDEDNPVRG